MEGTVVSCAESDCGWFRHSLAFWSVSRTGVVGPTVTVVFAIVGPPDVAAPETKVIFSGARTGPDAYEGAVSVHLEATDPVPSSGYRIRCDLDGQFVWIPERDPIEVAPPASGSATHTVRYHAYDFAGHTEESKTITFTVSAVPVITTTSDVHGAYATDATVTLTPHSTGTGTLRTFHSLDGGPVTEGTFVSIGQPEQGEVMHSLEFWSADDAGHEQAAHRTVEFLMESLVGEDIVAAHLASGACVSAECHLSDGRTIHHEVVVPGTTYCATCHGPGIEPTTDCSRGDCHPGGMRAPLR